MANVLTCQIHIDGYRHVEIRSVILSAAKDLFGRRARSFAALRMTSRTPLTSAHGKPSLHMSNDVGNPYKLCHLIQ